MEDLRRPALLCPPDLVESARSRTAIGVHVLIRALVLLGLLAPLGLGCNDACERLGHALCERLEDDTGCQEWQAVAATVSDETCLKSLETLEGLPE